MTGASHTPRDELLHGYMVQHGLKSTRQRSLIIDTFFGLEGHHTVEELWARVRAKDSKVSVATVYRTMKLLSDCGLAHARNHNRSATSSSGTRWRPKPWNPWRGRAPRAPRRCDAPPGRRRCR